MCKLGLVSGDENVQKNDIFCSARHSAHPICPRENCECLHASIPTGPLAWIQLRTTITIHVQLGLVSGEENVPTTCFFISPTFCSPNMSKRKLWMCACLDPYGPTCLDITMYHNNDTCAGWASWLRRSFLLTAHNTLNGPWPSPPPACVSQKQQQ